MTAIITNNKFEQIISKPKINSLFLMHKTYYEKKIKNELLKKKFIKINSVFIKNNLKFENLSDYERKIVTGHFPLKFRLKVYKKIVNEKKLKITIQKILGTKNAYIYIPSMSRYALPNCRLSLTPWHDDSSYTPQFKKFITVWIPLVAINKKIGGICFLNNKQKKIKIDTKKGKIFFSKYKLTKKASTRYYNCNIGDALIFDNKTVHKSLLNKSKIIRYSIDFRVSSTKAINKHCYSLKDNKIILPRK